MKQLLLPLSLLIGTAFFTACGGNANTETEFDTTTASTNTLTDTDLKAGTGKTLPVLRTHLDSAKAIT